MMRNNSLPIHTKSGNICHQNFNANENFFNFILAEQGDIWHLSLKELPKTTASRNIGKISYRHFL